mmetsp:Transcript_56319/g.100324  ORF Transcript_56319/g.100324 Transcript_56319/m.100324 type:complete len:91 (+) Transcript_56319:361-633(+)
MQNLWSRKRGATTQVPGGNLSQMLTGRQKKKLSSGAAVGPQGGGNGRDKTIQTRSQRSSKISGVEAVQVPSSREEECAAFLHRRAQSVHQ